MIPSAETQEGQNLPFLGFGRAGQLQGTDLPAASTLKRGSQRVLHMVVGVAAKDSQCVCWAYAVPYAVPTFTSTRSYYAVVTLLRVTAILQQHAFKRRAVIGRDASDAADVSTCR